MSTQLYRITRRGILHSRLEWPNGEVVKGSTHRMNERSEYVAIIDKSKGGDGRYARRFYGTKKPATGEPVSSTIRMTQESYRKMRREWGLEPVIVGIDADTQLLGSRGGQDGQKAIDPARRSSDDERAPEGSGDGDEQVPAANVRNGGTVDIPANWRTLNQSSLSKIVSELYEQPYKSMPKDQAVALIETFLEDATNGGEANS